MTRSANFYAVRTPLLPVEYLDRLSHLTPENLAAAMKELFADPILQDAIYIASPELFQEMKRWMESDSLSEKDTAKLSMSLYRYLLRMVARCTPYGLFAGCATGNVADYTSVQLGAPEEHLRHCRLDMNYVAELAASITAIPEIKEQLLFYPNNSIYASGSRFRYAAYTIRNKYRNYFLTAVNKSDYLETILRQAANGATLETIRQSIVSEENDITWYDAAEFTEELMANQLLVSELEATVTGQEFFTRLCNRLATMPEAAEITHKLSAIRDLLRQPNIHAYTQINQIVKELLPTTSNKDLLQTDLILHTHQNQLSTKVTDELTAEVSSLLQLARPGITPDLDQFINAFSSRYESQEVPLQLALDTEAGIGYGSNSGPGSDHTPLLDDLVLPASENNDPIQRSRMLYFQLQRLQESRAKGAQNITLTTEDITSLIEPGTKKYPASMYTMGKLLAKDAAAMDAGDYLFDMSGCSGPSAANLLGRFCHGDAALLEHVRSVLKQEEAQQPDAIFAEIAHLPESRTGNILMRPQLRDYEIVYLAASEMPAEQQIHVDDLLVSIQSGKVRLRSKRLNKWVIPRLSTAHNYRNGLPVYKFLCDIQHQDYHPAFSWQWLVPDDWSALPRVTYGKCILSKRMWMWRKKETTYKAGSYMPLIDQFCKEWELPRFVLVTEGDNELVIDLNCIAARHLLGKIMDKSTQVMLQEFLQTPDQCWVTGPGGHYTNEIILPLMNEEGAIGLPVVSPNKPDIQRSFLTGGEWLYVKLYCGSRTAEDMLREILQPLVQSLQEDEIIEKWFFIRYTDPDHHLRIRFYNSSRPDFWQIVLQRLYAALQEAENALLIHKVQTDTYVREIERYGVQTMDFSESVFHIDSDFVLAITQLLDEEAGEDYRWKLGVVGTDQLLDIFGFTMEEKSKYMQQLQQGFFLEFKGNKALQQLLNDKYRKESAELHTMLSGELPEEVLALMEQRKVRMQSAIAAQGNIEKYELLSSYIHMFLNRFLLAGQRKHELVIYHFLDRYYQSQQARMKKQEKIKEIS
ncbi:thiopeptide-type bacteriocin biosynthesis protein [Chitinophaga dinghuensis]|uniref:Thiopeptide-type bacteriocin biosynthesis protein n=1 Tax=Chitinophaga dinghuensis TaxID=1539050 RepID=A0A327VWF3_9BACT|nr:lantibiotic dehydratase [Chitinophaga dinghuensis]RAJ80327.1 thiopeptide-type bacteriocin biosynthesis protein [Chitinophaga dinghuensis]